jgi:hypothetical protein
MILKALDQESEIASDNAVDHDHSHPNNFTGPPKSGSRAVMAARSFPGVKHACFAR